MPSVKPKDSRLLTTMNNINARIYVAGHRGMVGSAIIRKLMATGYTNLITRTSKELDLTNQKAVTDFFGRENPEYVFLAAAKVGGIHANNVYRGDFIYQNLMIQTNIIHQSYLHGVKQLLFLGSSCIYPRVCPQPIKEEYLMTGSLEPTNSPYATAKIAGIEMCWAYNKQYNTKFIPVMPTNLYGNNDNFDLNTSHVLPALIRKFHLAKMASMGDIKAIKEDEKQFGTIPDDIIESIGIVNNQLSTTLQPRVIIWGTGTPKREFLHVEDMANACLYIMNRYSQIKDYTDNCRNLLFNIGSGKDQTIKELAVLVKEIIGFEGDLIFDDTKPDGTPRKLLDVNRLNNIGWQANIELKEGVAKVYQWYATQTSYPNNP